MFSRALRVFLAALCFVPLHESRAAASVVAAALRAGAAQGGAGAAGVAAVGMVPAAVSPGVSLRTGSRLAGTVPGVVSPSVLPEVMSAGLGVAGDALPFEAVAASVAGPRSAPILGPTAAGGREATRISGGSARASLQGRDSAYRPARRVSRNGSPSGAASAGVAGGIKTRARRVDTLLPVPVRSMPAEAAWVVGRRLLDGSGAGPGRVALSPSAAPVLDGSPAPGTGLAPAAAREDSSKRASAAPIVPSLGGELDAKADGSWLSRLRRRISAPWRVIPDKARNRQFWKFIAGQTMIYLGTAFQTTALPGLAAKTREQSANLGYARAVNWAGQAAATLTTGPLVDRWSIRNILSGSYFARSLLLMSVPVLFFNGYYTFAALQLVILATSFLDSLDTTASSVAFMRILGGDQKLLNKGYAILELTRNLGGVLAPLLAGSFIGVMNIKLGAQAGNALAFGVLGLTAMAVSVAFRLFLRVPLDELGPVRKRLFKHLDTAPLKGEIKRVSAAQEAGKPVLVVETVSDPAEVGGIPEKFEGYAVRTSRAARPLKEMLEGLRLNWKDRFLRRTLLLATMDLMASDALIFAALPLYISKVLPATVVPAWLTQLPLIGPLFAGLGTLSGAFGLYLAAASLGLGLVTLALTFMKGAADKKGRTDEGLDKLERQARGSSFLYGLGVLAYWGMFFGPNLWFSVLMAFIGTALQAPSNVVWASMRHRVILSRYPQAAGKIFSFRYLYYILCSVLGVLAFGGLISALSTSAVLWVVGGVLTVVALCNFLQPFLVLGKDKSVPQ